MKAGREMMDMAGSADGQPNIWAVLAVMIGVVLVVWLVIWMSRQRTHLPEEARLAGFVLLPQSGPWLGMDLLPPGGADRPDLGRPAGVVVARVMARSPADAAGIRAGDVLEVVDGRRVRRPADLLPIVADHQVGDTIRLNIARAGVSRALHLTLAARPGATLAAATAPAGWAGLDLQPISGLMAQRLGLPDDRGAIVSWVHPQSPAAAAGVRQGDVIRRLGGTRLRDMNQLRDLVTASRPGDTLHLAIWRQGAQKDVRVTLAPRPAGRAATAAPLPEAEVEIEAAWLGLDIVPLSRREAEELGIPEGTRGMVVDDVANGRGVDAGFQPGDVIIAVNGRATGTVTDFQDATEGAVGALVDVVRLGHHVYISVPPPGAVPADKAKPPVQAM